MHISIQEIVMDANELTCRVLTGGGYFLTVLVEESCDENYEKGECFRLTASSVPELMRYPRAMLRLTVVKDGLCFRDVAFIASRESKR